MNNNDMNDRNKLQWNPSKWNPRMSYYRLTRIESRETVDLYCIMIPSSQYRLTSYCRLIQIKFPGLTKFDAECTVISIEYNGKSFVCTARWVNARSSVTGSCWRRCRPRHPAWWPCRVRDSWRRWSPSYGTCSRRPPTTRRRRPKSGRCCLSIGMFIRWVAEFYSTGRILMNSGVFSFHFSRKSSNQHPRQIID